MLWTGRGQQRQNIDALLATPLVEVRVAEELLKVRVLLPLEAAATVVAVVKATATIAPHVIIRRALL